MEDNVKVAERDATLEEMRVIDDNLRLPAVPDQVSYPIVTDTPEARTQTPAVGQRASRPDGRLHGLGQTKYIDDMYFPGMIHAKIKRSGISKARIKSIDVSEAEKMPGVMATLIGKEIPINSFGPSYQDQPVIADEMVFHAGDAVAAVAAVTEQLAQDALEKIKIDYEPLDPVYDPIEAMKESAPQVHEGGSNIYATKVIQKGDVEQGFKDAYRIYENTFSTQMVEHVPMEPHASIADWDGNGRVTLHSSLGRITLGRADISRTLDIPINRVRIIATVVGGNFGGKNEITTEPILALLSRRPAGRSRAYTHGKTNLSRPRPVTHLSWTIKPVWIKTVRLLPEKFGWYVTVEPIAPGLKQLWVRPVSSPPGHITLKICMLKLSRFTLIKQ